jgi:hypothetical protein
LFDAGMDNTSQVHVMQAVAQNTNIMLSRWPCGMDAASATSRMVLKALI